MFKQDFISDITQTSTVLSPDFPSSFVCSKRSAQPDTLGQPNFQSRGSTQQDLAALEKLTREPGPDKLNQDVYKADVT